MLVIHLEFEGGVRVEECRECLESSLVVYIYPMGLVNTLNMSYIEQPSILTSICTLK